MSGRMAPAWFSWVEGKLSNQQDILNNLEETLKSYHLYKRMLYWIIVLNIGLVIMNGVLLYDF